MSARDFPSIDESTWRAAVEKSLRGARLSSLDHPVDDGVTVPPLATNAPPGTRPALADLGPARAVSTLHGSTAADRARRADEEIRAGVDALAGPPPGPESVDELRDLLGRLPKDGRLIWRSGEAAAGVAALAAVADDPRILVLGDGAEAPHEVRAIARWTGSASVSGVRFHEAGAGPATEAGLALAAAVEALRAGEEDPPTTLRVELAVGREVFPEIAKLRAMRLLIVRLEAAAGVALRPELHATASRRTLTRRDPWVNLLRATVQTFAGLAGGADFVTTTCFDEAVRSPDALGRRVARNTPEILLRECALDAVRDPAGGSYLVETLTDRIARAAWDVMRDVERSGGLRSALRDGSVTDRLERDWRSWQERIAAGDAPITGVTAYANADERPLPAGAGTPAPAAAPDPPALPDPADETAWSDALLDAARRGYGAGTLRAAVLASRSEPESPTLPVRRDAEAFETAEEVVR